MSEPERDVHLGRHLAGIAGERLLSAILATCRWQLRDRERYLRFWNEGRPVVFALWHGRMLPCIYQHRWQNWVTLISLHRDGDYIAEVLRRWGYTGVRGSSSRGASQALRELVRSAREGRSVALTPDGPRGPREQLKPGVLSVAQLAGAPLIPVTAAADRAWWFGGWDRFLLPQPFARVVVLYGEPMHVPRDADAGEMEGLRQEMEQRLRDLTAEADGGVRGS